MEVLQIEISKTAKRQLSKVPWFIQASFFGWIDRIKREGLQETRKNKGYHDELLKGNRKGQRSVRLNDAYRAIYILIYLDEIKILKVIEINKHRY